MDYNENKNVLFASLILTLILLASLGVFIPMVMFLPKNILDCIKNITLFTSIFFIFAILVLVAIGKITRKMK